MEQILSGMILSIIVIYFMYSQGDFEAKKNRNKTHGGK